MRRKNLKEFIYLSNLKHNFKYNYSKSIYVNNKTHVIITCPEHGDFEQAASNHISGNGCPTCWLDRKTKCFSSHYLIKKFKGLVQPDGYKLIPLTKGKFAKVDNGCFEKLKDINWFLSTTGYANNRKLGYMHRYILGITDDKNIYTDHINGDRLDNTTKNLRACTPLENNFNKSSPKGRYTSNYKGVYWDKKYSMWRAVLRINKEVHQLGLFDSEVSAAKAYDELAIKIHGEFMKPNI